MTQHSLANDRKVPPATKGDLALGLIRPAARIGTWLCALLLAILSFVPGEWLLRSNKFFDIEPIPIMEHALAYFLTGIIVAIGYVPHDRRRQLVLPILAYAALIEVGQYLTPDRCPGLSEFGAGALGTFCGIVIGEKISAWLSARARPASIARALLGRCHTRSPPVDHSTILTRLLG